MNWYKIRKSAESIADLAYNEWKNSSFDANVGTIIHRIYQIGVSKDAKRDELDERIEQVVKELINEDGELQMWHKVIKDRKYYGKIKHSVKKQYKKKINEIEKSKRGPLPINTPQTPSAPPGGGGGGGMLM